MNDAECLNWIADRFVNVHGESENVDFVQRLRKIANAAEARQAEDAIQSPCGARDCPTCYPQEQAAANSLPSTPVN